MRNNNMSANDLQNYYDDILAREGLNINPVAYHGTGLAADESLRELQRPEVTGGRNSMGNPQTTAPVEPGRVSQDSIEWRNRRLYEYEQQEVAAAIRRGMDPETAQALARQKTQELAFNQSGLTDVTQSRGGPVTQVRPPNPVPPQVGTVDSGPKLDVAGRPQVDRSGQVTRDTRPLMQGDIGTIPKPPPPAQVAKSAAQGAPTPPVRSFGNRLMRQSLMMAPLGALSLGASALEVKAREDEFRQSPTELNKAKRDMARFGLAADTAGTAPIAAPIAEPLSMGAGAALTLMDNAPAIASTGRAAANTVQRANAAVRAPLKPLDDIIGRGVNWVGSQIQSRLGIGPKPQPQQPLRIPRQQDLKPEQWSAFQAGGGGAKMRQGLTTQQVIELGRRNRR